MAISVQDLPPNWAGLGQQGRIDWFKEHNVSAQDLLDAGWINPNEVNWFLDQGLREGAPPASSPASSPADSTTETDATQRIENLANELGIPKFVVANLVNNGISDASIREKYRSTGTGTETGTETGTGTGPSAGPSTGTGTGPSTGSSTGTKTDSLAGTKITGSGGTKQLTLPEGWDKYTEDAKLKWFRDNNVLVSDLQAAGVSATDILYMLQKGYQGLADLTKSSGFDTSEGYGGVKVEGESGLREGYAPYVQDYLERMSGLLARRNVDPITGKPVYTGPQFGDTGVGGYGADTLTNLKALQTQRENMMGMGTGAGATPMYTPSKFSFASPNTYSSTKLSNISCACLLPFSSVLLEMLHMV